MWAFGCTRLRGGAIIAPSRALRKDPRSDRRKCADRFDRLGQYAWMISTFGGKYVAGMATASSFGAAKAAKELAAALRDSLFRAGLGLRDSGHPPSRPACFRHAKEAMNGVYEELVRTGIVVRPEA